MIERWFEPFTLLVQETASAPSVPFLSFRGVLSMIPAVQTDMAEQLPPADALVLLHEFDVTLVPGDLVRREKSGFIYRVTGRFGSMRSPAFSGLRFAQVPVERLEIPC